MPGVDFSVLGPCEPSQTLLPDQVWIVLPRDAPGPIVRMVDVVIRRIQEKSQVVWRATSSETGPKLSFYSVFVAVEPANPQKIIPERYRLFTTDQALYLYGDDVAGVVFGLGRLLRLLSAGWTQSYSSPIQRFVCVPTQLLIDSAPEYPVRGHQIAYRALSDSYGGWSFAQMERYIEDLVIFGTNTIECVFLDGNTSPQLIVAPADMLVHMSFVSNAFGLNFSIWYPYGSQLFDPKYELIRRMPRVNSIFIPGGDPGSLSPAPLLQYIKTIIASVRIFHPESQVRFAPFCAS